MASARRPGRKPAYRFDYAWGSSHLPDSADRKIASITAILRMLDSRGTGTSPSLRIAREKRSPCAVYWSHFGARPTTPRWWWRENVGGSEDAFAKQMTHKAQALGMTHTVYRNASGLPNDEQITTARDQALLGRAIQERFPRYYKYFSTRSFEFRGESIGNHNHLLGSIDGVDGIKTGYISASGFNIITSLHRDNRYLVAVVFGGSSAGSRDERVRGLIHDHIAEASVQHTAASLIAEADKPEARPAAKAAAQTVASAASVPVSVTVAKPEAKPNSKSAAKGKPETKSAPPAYALASATSLLVTLPAKNETKNETKTEPKPEAKAAQTYAVASATSVPVTLTSKSDPSATTTVQVPRWSATNSVPAPRVAPAVGSENPIHPVLVKTVMVRPGIAAQTASVGPLQPSAPAEPPAPAPAPAPATTPAPALIPRTTIVTGRIGHHEAKRAYQQGEWQRHREQLTDVAGGTGASCTPSPALAVHHVLGKSCASDVVFDDVGGKDHAVPCFGGEFSDNEVFR